MCQAVLEGSLMRRLLLIAAIALPQAAIAADSLVVHAVEVQDQKAVVATVEPVHQLVARARLGGTIVSLKAKEGERAEAGAELATVADPKLDFAHFRAPVSEGGPKDRRFRDDAHGLFDRQRRASKGAERRPSFLPQRPVED